MKSLEELKQIRSQSKGSGGYRGRLRRKNPCRCGNGYLCGIASGAKPVLSALADEVQRRHLKNVIVTQTGCIGCASMSRS